MGAAEELSLDESYDRNIEPRGIERGPQTTVECLPPYRIAFPPS